MGIGADGLDVAAHGDQAVRGAGEAFAQALDHGLDRPVLPQEAVASARAEIGDQQVGQGAQHLDLFPQAGHGAGVKHLQFEPAQGFQDGTRPQFHQDGQRGNFPQHHLGPAAFEGQFILAVALFQVIGGQAQVFQELHEVRAEHLALAVKGVAAQPGAFAPGQRQAADVIQLFAQLAFVDQVGQADVGRTVDQAEPDHRVGPVAKDRLAHQQLVEIRVDQRPHDGVDLPFVVIDAGGDIGHRLTPG